MAQTADNSLEAHLRNLGRAASRSSAGVDRAEQLAPVAGPGADWADAGVWVEVEVTAGLDVTVSATLTATSGATLLYGYEVLGPSFAPGQVSGSAAAPPDDSRALATSGVLAAELTLTHDNLSPGWYRVAARMRGTGTVAHRRLRVVPR